MESSAPAGQAGPDLFFAWTLATNIDVRAFPADDERAAQEALGEHPAATCSLMTTEPGDP